MQSTDANHPQNYNPYGDSPAWTDNGLVIIRHKSDIGDGSNASEIIFYSLISHLSELSGNFQKVASGTATPLQTQVSRKEVIGAAGAIYGARDHIHMEIVCGESSFKKLVGRGNGQIDLSANGRKDSIYGEIYFILPNDTKIFSDRPTDHIIHPSSTVSYTTTEKICVGIRYCNGDGPHPGDAYLTSYTMEGMTIGEPIREPNAEYDLLLRSTSIRKAFEKDDQPPPTVSAVYELLRFGRIIGPDELGPKPFLIGGAYTIPLVQDG